MRNDRRAGTGARAVINQSINQYIDPFFHPRHLCPHAVMGRSTSPDPISRGPTRTHQQIAYEQSPDNDLPPARCRIKRGQSRQFNDLDSQEELCQGTSMTIPSPWTIVDGTGGLFRAHFDKQSENACHGTNSRSSISYLLSCARRVIATPPIACDLPSLCLDSRLYTSTPR